MAATTYVTVTNLTATTITVSGDEGKNSITIGHTPGANSAVVYLKNLIGDYLLCSTLADWITAGKVSITRGSVTLPAADLDAYAQGSDMNRADYDADDDGIVDAAESIDFASVTAETALAVGDSFLIYDLSATATRKMTVPNAMNISVLSAATSAADDSALIYDATASAVRKTTVEDLLNPLKLTPAAAVAEDDLVILHDLTAPTIASSTTVSRLVNPNNLTAETVSDDADTIIIYDNSAAAVRSMTRANFLNPAIVHESHLQAVAASNTDTLFIAGAAGTVLRALAMAGTAAAAGESMAIDVQIGGVTCLTGAINIDNAAGTTVVTGTVDAAADDLLAGDVVTVVRTYVAGGGPTPMANTHVSVWFSQSL